MVGGLAVSVRTAPRFTRDADLAVSVEDDEGAQHLLRSLLARGYAIDAVVEQERVGRLATARLVPPGEAPDGVILDLLFASSGIEPEIVADAESVEVVEGLRIKVARRPHLVACKLLSRDDEHRPQDKADLLALLEGASSEDLSATKRLLRLIEARGFARGKDLLAELERLT